MRFRPKRILTYLFVGVSVVVVLANFISYNDKASVVERHPVYEGLLGPRNPNPISYEDRFKKYGIASTAPLILKIPVSQTSVLNGQRVTVAPQTVGVVAQDFEGEIAFNGSENELYREKLVRRVGYDEVKGSVWVAEMDRQHRVVDDRLVKQMNFVPERYRRQVRRARQSGRSERTVGMKTIYIPSGVDPETPLGTIKFVIEQCPVRACNITTDPIHEKTADLRLLQADAYFSPSEKKPPGQLWAMWILESPANTAEFIGAENLINWTATYRWDSTIVTPYAKFVPFSSSRSTRVGDQKTIQGHNYGANKTKMVAWFVSNCNAKNKRWEFAQELKKYIPVDIFGACGTMDCPRSLQNDCNERLSTDYKFYLSFENSNCDYYITEKFFEIGLSNDVVPIVMGARKADYARAAPPHSYIYANDFLSAKDLANYLLKLNASDQLYNEYFRWKSTGNFINTKFWCRLCALLHDDQRPTMWYTDFHRWWTNEGSCRMNGWGD